MTAHPYQRMCSIDDCGAKHSARGWCRKHYQKWLRHGDPLGGRAVRVGCSVKNCEEKHGAKGYCRLHYNRFRRYGTTEQKQQQYRSLEDSFLNRVVENGKCMNWTGYKNISGYGVMYRENKALFAHRYAWERAHGAIPEGLVIDHKCFNPSCVNVDHLRVITQQQNTQHQKGPRIDNKAGYRGVSYDRRKNKYRSIVSHNKKQYFLGYYQSPVEAAVAAAEKRLDLGFPQSDSDRQLISGWGDEL